MSSEPTAIPFTAAECRLLQNVRAMDDRTRDYVIRVVARLAAMYPARTAPALRLVKGGRHD